MKLPIKPRTIRCPGCDERLLSVRGAATIFHGRRPLDFTARPAEAMVLMVCQVCGTLVAIDDDLVRLY